MESLEVCNDEPPNSSEGPSGHWLFRCQPYTGGVGHRFEEPWIAEVFINDDEGWP